MDINDIRSSPEKIHNLQQMVAITMNEYSSPDCPLYGNLFIFPPTDVVGSDLTQLYVVMGRDPIYAGPTLPAGLDLRAQLREQERNQSLFHTDVTVIDLDKVDDELNLSSDIVNWASTVAALHRIYTYEGHGDKVPLELPKAICKTEIDYLTQHEQALWNNSVSPEAKQELRGNLAKFFASERSTGFKGRWRDFFRSDRFPFTKNKVVQFWYYLHRTDGEVPLKHLTRLGDICKTTVTERDYQAFAATVKQKYPDLTYSVGKKVVTDEGVDKTPGETFRGVNRVSEDEYHAVKEKSFAQDGWAALQGLQPARWELRDLYYKEADKELVASILQKQQLTFAKPMPLCDIKDFGRFRVCVIDESDFDNVVAMMHANHVPFGLDTDGRFHSVQMGQMNVLVPDRYREMYLAIRQRIVNANICMAEDNPVFRNDAEYMAKQASRNPFHMAVPEEHGPCIDQQIADAQQKAAVLNDTRPPARKQEHERS